MARTPTLILDIILNMLLDTFRRATMRPIRTLTGNSNMDGGTRSMKSTDGTSTITTAVSSNKRVTAVRRTRIRSHLTARYLDDDSSHGK